jgi:hypothetical protein
VDINGKLISQDTRYARYLWKKTLTISGMIPLSENLSQNLSQYLVQL